MKLPPATEKRYDPDNNCDNHYNSNNACNSSCFKYAGYNRTAA